MSLLDTQNFLARIYTDENLRREFLSAPETVGSEHHLTENEIVEIIEIFPDEINVFAESLFWKRLREVEKLLPLTKHYLTTDFAVRFREFSTTFNSQSVKKHLEDAIHFGKSLEQQDIDRTAKNAVRYERLNLTFNAGNKHLICAAFDFDVRQFRAVKSGGKGIAPTEIEPKKIFALWLRFGRIEKHFIW